MPPTAEARATADRFMFDTGNLKYLASQLPDGGLDRIVPGAGWTIRQMLAHLAAAQDGYAEILDGLQRGVAPDPSRFDPTAHNAETAAKHSATPLAQLVSLFDSSVRRLVAALVLVDEAASKARVGLFDLPDVLHAWSNHAAGHGMEMLDVLPELRDDHMLLNWLLYEDFSDNPAHQASQQRLLEELREKYEAEGEDDDDDSDEEDEDE